MLVQDTCQNKSLKTCLFTFCASVTLNELLAFRGTYKDSAAELIESLPRKKSDFLLNKELDVISSCLVRERVCVCEDGVQHHTHCGKL